MNDTPTRTLPAIPGPSVPAEAHGGLNNPEMVAKATSPTGVPVIPPAAVPWLTSVVGIAGILAASLPEHTVGARVAQLVFALGAALGLASPGLRRKQ
jgi:hypothetical protein